ncbi:aminoglycoside 3'-phosphotransferase [Kitasatospora sp. P5_F3]
MIDSFRRRFDRHDWRPVTIGMSGAEVWHLVGGSAYFLKLAPGALGMALLGEAERYSWLAEQGFPTAEVVEHGADERGGWLLTTAAPGRSAAEPWPEHRRDAVVDALADCAAALHALPAGDCPFDRSLATLLPFAGLTIPRPPVEDLVVCHGDYCAPNILLDPDTLTVTALVDVGTLGVADRYTDLAQMARSLGNGLNPQYGPRSADRFVARYGATPLDEQRLAFYRLLDETVN